MSYLIVLNSCGPMGSTLLAGLIEKFGFFNVPLRKLGLHQYLMNEIDLNSGHMQSRLRAIITENSKPGLYGGVSVLDRNAQKPKALCDIRRVEAELAQFEQEKFSSISSLYFRASEIYARALTYKPATNPLYRLELTVDTHKYDPQLLYAAYTKNFPRVQFIHLKRDFAGWINALASQAFVHPHQWQKIRFFPAQKYLDWQRYNTCIAQTPGLQLDFEDLFMPIETLAQTLSDFLNLPLPQTPLRTATYDLYGKIVPYTHAFTKFDDTMVYLRPETRAWLRAQAEQGTLPHAPQALKAYILYLNDLLHWQNPDYRHTERAA